VPSEKPAAQLSNRLSSQDAVFLYGETHHGPLHMGCITWFDGRIDLDDFAVHMESRMHRLPRYRQRLAGVPLNLAHATLENDPAFEVRNHVYRHSLPSAAGEEQLFKAAMDVFARALDRTRPLWETHLFDGLAGGRTAILWKMHHCLIDGVSGMQLLSASLDLKPDSAPAPAKPFRPAPLPGPAKSFVLGVLDLMLGRLNHARRAARLIEPPSLAAKGIARMADFAGRIIQMMWRPIVPAPWNARLITAERVLACLRLPFADVRAIRNLCRGTANDVVLAILSEAAARYLACHGVASAGARFVSDARSAFAAETIRERWATAFQ
jgi:diacylglycerol O-acyltransferase